MSAGPAPLGPHDPVGRAGRLVYRFLWVLGRVLTRLYWRLEVVGAERIPRSGGFVISPVHRSNLDFFLAGLATPRPVRFMAKDSIFLGGWIDRFLLGLGAFPVHRGAVDREAVRRAEELLAAGHPVVIFPEGRRQEGPRVHELFNGPAFVACRQRVPIVPMGIGGSDRAMPIGSKFIFPRKVVIVVGEPIYPDVELRGRVPRSTVSALSGELREEIQRLYDLAVERSGVG